MVGMLYVKDYRKQADDLGLLLGSAVMRVITNPMQPFRKILITKKLEH